MLSKASTIEQDMSIDQLENQNDVLQDFWDKKNALGRYWGLYIIVGNAGYQATSFMDP